MPQRLNILVTLRLRSFNRIFNVLFASKPNFGFNYICKFKLIYEIFIFKCN